MVNPSLSSIVLPNGLEKKSSAQIIYDLPFLKSPLNFILTESPDFKGGVFLIYVVNGFHVGGSGSGSISGSCSGSASGSTGTWLKNSYVGLSPKPFVPENIACIAVALWNILSILVEEDTCHSRIFLLNDDAWKNILSILVTLLVSQLLILLLKFSAAEFLPLSNNPTISVTELTSHVLISP